MKELILAGILALVFAGLIVVAFMPAKRPITGPTLGPEMDHTHTAPFTSSDAPGHTHTFPIPQEVEWQARELERQAQALRDNARGVVRGFGHDVTLPDGTKGIEFP